MWSQMYEEKNVKTEYCKASVCKKHGSGGIEREKERKAEVERQNRKSVQRGRERKKYVERHCKKSGVLVP